MRDLQGKIKEGRSVKLPYCNFAFRGGGLIISSLNDCSIRQVASSAVVVYVPCWINFFVVAEMTFIPKELRVEGYVRVVAVNVVKPYRVVDNLSRTLAADLAHSTVNQCALFNECLPCTQPRH
jgi:hypothetical protein